MAVNAGPAPNIVVNGLIRFFDALNYKSYGPTGSVWRDISGTTSMAVKAGSLSGSYPEFNQAGFFSFTGGTVGNNYSRFDVAGIPGLSAVSAFVWFRPSKGTEDKIYQTLFRMNNDDISISFTPWLIDYAAGSSFLVVGGSWQDAIAGGFTYGAWNFASLTYDGNTVKGYYNGNQVSSGYTSTNIYTEAGILRIGTRDDAYASHFFGDIACLALYNRALSASEVKQNFDSLRRRFEI